MLLLIAIDTSGRRGSVALCRGDADSFEVLQLTSLEGGTYSAQLVPAISHALQEQGLDKTDLDGFVVVSGPGSFTGLRVGLATVKGLCEVLQKPLAIVSMLETVALTYGRPGQTATAVLDAGRGEVYVGEYRVSGGNAAIVREYIAKLDVLVEDTRAIGGDLLTPDANVAERLRAANINVKLVHALQAEQIGRIGLTKLLAGDVADPATVDVNYIRRSDAEIFFAPSIDLVLIRQATPDDVAAIRKLEQEAETAAHWSQKEYDALFASDAPARIALVAAGEADVAGMHGFVIARCTAEEWEIENVVVAPDKRRRGVATALVGDLLREAAQAGAAAVLLEVRESNLSARQLYEKYGFSVVGRRASYYRDPLEDGLLMRISIAVP